MQQPLRWCGVDYFNIPGFPGYMAGTDGSILSRKRGANLLKYDLRESDNRRRVTLCLYGKTVRKYVSYFVLITFVGPKPYGMQACHGDGDCTNDSSENLRWGTPTENSADSIKHGVQVSGESHPKAKITDAQADEIIQKRKDGWSLKRLSAEYKISQSSVSYAATGKRKKCRKKAKVPAQG